MGDKYGYYGYFFIAPFFIVLAIFSAYPMLYSLGLSFFEWDGTARPATFVGGKNFIALLSDETFRDAILNTWILWLVNVIPQMIFGLLMAIILTDEKIRAKGFFRGVFYLPNLITMSSVGALFYFIMDWQSGSLNQILMNLHIIDEPFNWLQDIFATRTSVSAILTWMWFGYTMIIFMAGIKAIPTELFEAGYVDGTTKWQSFRYITLPSIKPTMLYQIVTSLIGGMTLFDIPNVLTGGNGEPQGSILTMVMYLYNMAFKSNYFGYAATIGVGLFLIILIFVVLAFKLLKADVD